MDEKRQLWIKSALYGRKLHLWMKNVVLWTKSALYGPDLHLWTKNSFFYEKKIPAFLNNLTRINHYYDNFTALEYKENKQEI